MLLNFSSILTYTFLDHIHNHAELKRLLEDINVPLRRMNDNLKNIQDDLQGEQFTNRTKHSLMVSSIQAHRDSTVAVA